MMSVLKIKKGEEKLSKVKEITIAQVVDFMEKKVEECNNVPIDGVVKVLPSEEELEKIYDALKDLFDILKCYRAHQMKKKYKI